MKAADNAAQYETKLAKILSKIDGIYSMLILLGYYAGYHDAANGKKEYWTIEKI